MRFGPQTILLISVGLASASCSSVPSHSVVAQSSISIDQPEIFDNSSLQSQFDNLRAQLAQLGIVDTTTLTGALGNVQGTSISQSNVSFQVLAPSASASTTPAVPAA